MSDAKHTPGPWEAVRSVTCGHLRAAHNYRINPRLEWTDADIALINAAPDLLTACEEALPWLAMEMAGRQWMHPQAIVNHCQDLVAIQAAIAKAKGGSA